MSYRYPYGNTEQMNLDWFLNQWEKFKADWAEAEAGIDGSLDAEIAKVEAAMSELYAARDAAAASATAARQSSLDAAAAQVAAGNSKTAAQAAETAARGSQQAAAESAQEAQASATGAENSAITATQAANTATQQAAGSDAAKGAAEAAQQAAEAAQAAAAQSAGQAGQAATAAADHADNAADSATLAQQAAQDMSDSVAQITTNKNDIGVLKESISYIGFGSLGLLTADNSMILPGYIGLDGIYAPNDYYRASDFIRVKSGDNIAYYHLLGSANTLVVAFYDSNKTFVSDSGIAGTQAWQDGLFTAPSDGFVRFTTTANVLNNLIFTPSIKDSRLRAADSNLLEMKSGAYYLSAVDFVDIRTFPFLNAENALIQSGYINTSGTELPLATFVRTPYISIRAGQSITYYHLAGTGGSNVVSFYDENKTYISGTVGNGGWSDGTFTAAENGYVRFCTQTQYLSNAKLTPSKTVSELINEYVNTPEHKQYILTGKTLDTIGDSLTQLSYITGGNKKWQTYLQEWLKLSATYNHGVDSSRISGAAANAMWQDARINAINANADIVIVMGGVNDWANNVVIGDKAYNNENTNTFFGACNVLFRKLTKRLPNARIVAFGTTFAYYPNRSGFTDTTGILNNNNLSSVDYSDAMMESARLNGIEHYDIGGNLGVNVSNIENSFNIDETFYIHPNETGIEMIAAFMAKNLL